MWAFEYEQDVDETTIYWDDEPQGTVQGEITQWQDGYPIGQAREVVADAIQNAGTPQRIRMQFDLNYGFEDVTPRDQS